jgi:hypothetical protein
VAVAVSVTELSASAAHAPPPDAERLRLTAAGTVTVVVALLLQPPALLATTVMVCVCGLLVGVYVRDAVPGWLVDVVVATSSLKTYLVAPVTLAV